MKKILFITHEASRTGAPFLLLYFLKWLNKEHSEINKDVLLLKDGDLKKDFRHVANSIFIWKSMNVVSNKIINKILKLIIFFKDKENKKILKKIIKKKYSLIYANTIVSIPIAIMIKREHPSVRLLVHVHEMQSVLELYRNFVLPFIDDIDQFITVSQEAKKHFIRFTNVNEEKVEMIYEFSDRVFVKKEEKKTHFIVGGAGTTNFRKGTDLFIELAYLKMKNYTDLPVKFVWVGSITNEFKFIVENEIRKLEIYDVIEFTGELEVPEEVYKTFDLFVLTSREDPFPLVCVEMGKLGIPIICFNQGNGIGEIISSGGGKIVPYLDLSSMMESIEFYVNNFESYNNDCIINKKQFCFFNSDNQAPKIFNSFQHLL